MARPPSTSISDQFLGTQCLTLDRIAWHMLHERHQPDLLRHVRSLLAAGTADADGVAEEIAGAAWSTLFLDDCRRLQGWDPVRGTFFAYLCVLVRRELQLHFRRSQERRARSTSLSDRHLCDKEAILGSVAAALHDFLPTLTPREREFMRLYQMKDQDEGPARSYSEANRRQLQSRVEKKLHKYLERD